MDHISHKSDDGSINLEDPRILEAETSQKDNLHLGKEMKAEDRAYSMTAMKKNTRFDHRRCLVNTSKIIDSKFSTHNPINMELKKKKKTIYIANQTQGPFMCTWWYATRRD